MSKRANTEVTTSPDPSDFTTPEALAFVKARTNVDHYLFATNEGGDGITAFTWRPSEDGAKLLYYLINAPDDDQGYPTTQANLFNSIKHLYSSDEDIWEELRGESEEEIRKVLPSFHRKVNTLGTIADAPTYTSPDPVPRIAVKCCGWC